MRVRARARELDGLVEARGVGAEEEHLVRVRIRVRDRVRVRVTLTLTLTLILRKSTVGKASTSGWRSSLALACAVNRQEAGRAPTSGRQGRPANAKDAN